MPLGEIEDIYSAIARDVPEEFRDQIAVRTSVGSSCEASIKLHLARGIRWIPVGEHHVSLVEVADAVQDFVCDEVGAPWPEVVTSAGEFVEVLEPRLRDGRAVWAGRAVCGAVGDLRAAVARAGLRLR